MNIIPFPNRFRAQPEPEPLAFTIGARVDLRIGALACGVVRARGDADDCFTFTRLSRLLRGARMAWRERCALAPLTLAVPSDVLRTLDAELLSEAAIESGCTRRNFTFELEERCLADGGVEIAEDLRARGWSLALRGDPECPLPLGAKARALYDEIVLDAPEHPGPFLAVADADESPLSRRIASAKAAGLILSAESVTNTKQARILAVAGFDRGGGPFAEAGLR